MVSANSTARCRQVPVGTHFVDKADAFGLAGVDHPTRDDQLDRAPVPQNAGEPLGAAVSQSDVPPTAGHSEGGVLVGDRHVGPSVAYLNCCILPATVAHFSRVMAATCSQAVTTVHR